MEAFKISVEVNVNLSLTESTQAFIQGCLINRALVNCLGGPVNLSSLCGCKPNPVSEEAPKAEAPKAEAPKAEAPKAEAPKAEAPKAEAPKAEAPKAEAKKLDIEDLRVVLKNKVNTHREAIKAKLTELGAPSVTKLAEDKYEEMYNFLTSLSNE